VWANEVAEMLEEAKKAISVDKLAGGEGRGGHREGRTGCSIGPRLPK